MEGNRTILDPPEVQAASARAIEKKPQVFSFGERPRGPIAEPSACH